MRCNPRQHEDACADDCSYPEACELDWTKNPAQTIFAAEFFKQCFMRLRRE
jgi:hypothetical protein